MINLPFDRALIVRAPHIDNILDNGKTWELRSSKTKIRGKVGLIDAGTGLIVGEVEIIDSLDKQSDFDLFVSTEEHQCDYDTLPDKWRFPWLLENAIRYKEPIPYTHPQGAVIWVKL